MLTQLAVLVYRHGVVVAVGLFTRPWLERVVASCAVVRASASVRRTGRGRVQQATRASASAAKLTKSHAVRSHTSVSCEWRAVKFHSFPRESSEEVAANS